MRGIVPHRQRRHHHRHHHQQKVRQRHQKDETLEESEKKRPKVNPIFLWASQQEQRIIEVRCEDYDKRNRIKLTKTAQGWRSIPRTKSNSFTLATASKRTLIQIDSSASSASSNDEKENGEQDQEAPTVTMDSLRRLPRKYPANDATNDLLTVEDTGKKKRYDEMMVRSDNRRGFSYSLSRNNSDWDSNENCSDDDSNDSNDSTNGQEKNEEQVRERSKIENYLFCLKNKDKYGRINLERLQKDKLFQPRVVLEQLHLSQLPESVHLNIVRHTREKNKDVITNETEKMEENDEQVETDVINEAGKEKDNDKHPRMNKAGIQNVLNMIDTTASPDLSTDTLNINLPVDYIKTYETLSESAQERQSMENKIKDVNSAHQLFDDLENQLIEQSGYQTNTIESSDDIVDEKIEVHEENILEDCCMEIEENKIHEENETILFPLKDSSEAMLKSCKVAEADGGFANQSKCKSNFVVACSNRMDLSIGTTLETEKEAPDEPGELVKIDYNDSSKILDALRNTPGLSVSVTRTHTPEIGKSPSVPPARPPSKASSSSRSPDSQAECVEKLLKNSVDSATTGNFIDNRGCPHSPRNLPGLSIIIPSYRYRSTSETVTVSPNTKRSVESPESTVSFNKTDAYLKMKLNGFSHEQGEEDEDDCDSQVLEDLRRQTADSLPYDGMEANYFNGPISKYNQENKKTPIENAKGNPLLVNSGKNSEAQAKCKYQDLEHFDEQVLEELRSRGTVVSPQPSGIPCSPAARKPSSTYLERLLPSPPCSVSCSEDAKTEVTLKNILNSSNCAEQKDYERFKEGTLIRSDQSIDPILRSMNSNVDRNTVARNNRTFQERLNSHNQETRNSGRPMSSGDIHSTFYMTDRVAPKRPMSAEWSTARQRNQIGRYQKSFSKTRNHFVDHQETCATSTSTDKLLGPASQLRELIETIGHLIPDPLLVPRDYLPSLAAAPAMEIPKLLASRPELRLPEALTRPDLLRDPDLLVISLAHLQQVLDHSEESVLKLQQPHPKVSNGINKGYSYNGAGENIINFKPKLSCKPIGTLMPAPIDLSSNRRISPYPPLLRVRSGLLKQESEVSSTASSPDESQLWHPLFGR